MLKIFKKILSVIFVLCIFLINYTQTSLTFDKCLKIAFKNNLSIKSAEISEQISNYEFKTSKTSMLPNIEGNLTSEYSWGRGIDPNTNDFINERFQAYKGDINSGLTLFSGFRNINLIKLAKQELESNKILINKIKNDITIEIAIKYTSILFLKEIIKSNEEQIKSTQKPQ